MFVLAGAGEVTMSLARELSSFPFPPQHLHKLNKAGYVTVEDLKGVSPTQLSEGKNPKYKNYLYFKLMKFYSCMVVINYKLTES